MKAQYGVASCGADTMKQVAKSIARHQRYGFWFWVGKARKGRSRENCFSVP